MGQVRFHKVVSALPSPLEKDGVYLVRTGEGFDLYASDSTGTIAHKVNTEASGGGSSVTLDGETSGFIHEDKTYIITNYNAFSQYTVQASAGQASVVDNQIMLKLPGTAGVVTLTVSVDGVDTQFSVQVKSAGVQMPQGILPAPGAVLETPSVTLTASGFTPLGAADVHASSDWQLAMDSGFNTVVKSANSDASNKTSWSAGGLQPNKTYFWRVRYRGVNNGVSKWSTPMSFQTASEFFGSIGSQGTQGFGVGVYPERLPEGFSEMDGTRDKASANYGNYTYTDGSVMVFVPRFYYRFSSPASPRHEKYGNNALDIVGTETFADEASANAAGYVMHRAFKDGGQHKHGFFIDKYLASRNEEADGCISTKGGVPLSLCSRYAEHGSTSVQLPGQSLLGHLSDAVLLARARGAGVFNTASVFMYGALAFLSFAHAQASTSTTYCAWYNEPHNFPKGCNNGALSDQDDRGVLYEPGEMYSGGGVGQSYKPKTGSANQMAKTTHNGQACGVVDLNGCMQELAIGITTPGTNLFNNFLTEVDEYCLKDSVALASLTSGWGGETDIWQDQAGINRLYAQLPRGSVLGSSRISVLWFGNGSQAAFSNATNGADYVMTCCGYPQAAVRSTSSSNVFGQDAITARWYSNLCVLVGGASASTTKDSGVFAKECSFVVQEGPTVGFRCAAYGG